MISFQNAVREYINEVERAVDFYEYALLNNIWMDEELFCEVLAWSGYYVDLLDALRGVDRLEKSHQFDFIPICCSEKDSPWDVLSKQWEKEKECER